MRVRSNVEVVVCPCCGQKLALQPYIIVGSRVVCANPNCNCTLRVTQRGPAKVVEVPIAETRTVDAAPESYG